MKTPSHCESVARQRGFTLVELMIVVLIVAILSAIAIPSYRQYVLRVNRTDAKVALTSIAQRLEQCFTRNNAYDTPPGPGICTVTLPYTTPDNTYTVTANGGDLAATSFLLTATPINGQIEDTGCGALTLNQLGVQGRSGTKPINECW